MILVFCSNLKSFPTQKFPHIWYLMCLMKPSISQQTWFCHLSPAYMIYVATVQPKLWQVKLWKISTKRILTRKLERIHSLEATKINHFCVSNTQTHSYKLASIVGKYYIPNLEYFKGFTRVIIMVTHWLLGTLLTLLLPVILSNQRSINVLLS